MGAESSHVDTTSRVARSESFEKWLANLHPEKADELLGVQLEDLKCTKELKEGDIVERHYTSRKVSFRIVADLPISEIKKIMRFVAKNLPKLSKEMTTGNLGSFWVEKDIQGIAKNPMVIGLYGLADPNEGSYKHQIPVDATQAKGHSLFMVTINRWGL